MVRYVPRNPDSYNVVRESYEKNSQHKRQIGRCNCILTEKNINYNLVAPLMPLEALLIPVNLTDSDSDGFNGGTGCNFIIFYFFISFSVEGVLATPFDIFGLKLVGSLVRTV